MRDEAVNPSDAGAVRISFPDTADTDDDSSSAAAHATGLVGRAYGISSVLPTTDSITAAVAIVS